MTDEAVLKELGITIKALDIRICPACAGTTHEYRAFAGLVCLPDVEYACPVCNKVWVTSRAVVDAVAAAGRKSPWYR